MPVVARVPYRTTKNGRQYYRQPAYLLTTNLTTPAEVLLQAYFDRQGIEVNHRDEKDILGVGQAQVSLLRKQLADQPVRFPTATAAPTDQTMVSAAAA